MFKCIIINLTFIISMNLFTLVAFNIGVELI